MNDFTQTTKVAVRRLYGGVCAKCGSPANHVDHVHPKAKGGAGEAYNAQLLCERCNTSLGATVKPRSGRFNIVKPEPPTNLRHWQSDCTDKQLTAIAQGVRQWFNAVCVSAGKTIQTYDLYLRGYFDLILVVVPKTGIRLSWAEDAERLGLRLETIVSGSSFTGISQRGSEYQLPNGFVLTFDMLPSVINDLQACGQMFKVLGAVDEAHHLGDGMQWTESVIAAFRQCDFVTALSGTHSPQLTNHSPSLTSQEITDSPYVDSCLSVQEETKQTAARIYLNGKLVENGLVDTTASSATAEQSEILE